MKINREDVFKFNHEIHRDFDQYEFKQLALDFIFNKLRNETNPELIFNRYHNLKTKIEVSSSKYNFLHRYIEFIRRNDIMAQTFLLYDYLKSSTFSDKNISMQRYFEDHAFINKKVLNLQELRNNLKYAYILHEYDLIGVILTKKYKCDVTQMHINSTLKNKHFNQILELFLSIKPDFYDCSSFDVVKFIKYFKNNIIFKEFMENQQDDNFDLVESEPELESYKRSLINKVIATDQSIPTLLDQSVPVDQVVSTNQPTQIKENVKENVKEDLKLISDALTDYKNLKLSELQRLIESKQTEAAQLKQSIEAIDNDVSLIRSPYHVDAAIKNSEHLLDSEIEDDELNELIIESLENTEEAITRVVEETTNQLLNMPAILNFNIDNKEPLTTEEKNSLINMIILTFKNDNIKSIKIVIK